MNDCGMSFSWNLFGITFDDAYHLSQGLSRAKNLKQLSLQANHITDDLCQLLCCGLKECANLEVLGNDLQLLHFISLHLRLSLL